MPLYYVNKTAQPNGDHDVHQSVECPVPAAKVDRLYLGDFPTCYAAVAEARKYYPQSNGCAYCLPECHTI